MRVALNLLFLIAGAVACTAALDLQPHDDQYKVCGRRAGLASDRSGAVVGKIRQVVDIRGMDHTSSTFGPKAC